ncbi:MAG: AAA-like domain-containing protein [Armatimonadetes bacterium]|nr:AAA-like domain-containing protein [Armatimonadota bacterium]
MNPDAATTMETIAHTLVADVALRRDERISAEVGHILFLDLVGYSRLSMEEQDRIARELRSLVRSTPEFQRAEVRGELICSDTGDGMALIFFRDPLAPVQCALEIARVVKPRMHLPLRMGVHSGPVTRVPDINGNDNVSGVGINMAQRVMDCGDGGHILLSSVSADMVRSFESYENSLRDLGEVTVKHGVKVHVFNLLMADAGNVVVPEKVRTDGASKKNGNGKVAANLSLPQSDMATSAAKGERPPIGVGKTVSLVYKRRGAPVDDRLGRMLEAELSACGFVVKVERQQQFSPAWVQEVEEQFAQSDAVVFLLSASSCASEMFEYEAKLATDVALMGTGLKPKLLAVRVSYEEDLVEGLFAAFGQKHAPLWESSADDEAMVQHVLAAFTQTPKPKLDHTKREKAGGAVPLNSAYYVVRPTDDEFTQAIARQDSIVLVKGGRQMGKTSLLARGVEEARKTGAKIVITDFQSLSAPDLVSADALYRALAEKIADDLDLDTLPGDVWNEKRSANMNLERYLRKEVLGAIGEVPLVWGLDEVDRLFTCDFGSEVFGLFRSWHNKRSLDPSGPWSRLTLAIAYATEAHLFITDMNQSPFNVGTRLTLSDFVPAQVGEINTRYGSPLSPTEVSTFHDLVGGQPYLTRRGLDELTASELTFTRFAAEAGRDEGVYGDHLRRMLLSLSQEPTLVEAMRLLLRGQPCPTPDVFYRLRTAGLVLGEGVGDVRIRCRVYQEYLSRHLA